MIPLSRPWHVPSLLGLLSCCLASAAAPLDVPADCDYLVLTDSLLLPQARRLADLRADLPSDHIRKPAVVTVADIRRAYPVQGAGYRSLLAFLQDVHSANGGLPAHLVLFGDASKDEASPHNHVATFIFHALQSDGRDMAAASDDLLAELLDSVPRDTLAPMAAVGRIPAHTLDQARQYVDKVVAYETRFAFGPEAFTYGFAADDDRQNGSVDPIWDLLLHHEQVWNSLKVKPFVRRLMSAEFPAGPDAAKPAARDSLVAILNSGPSRFYYVGHGHHNLLSDEKLFQVPADLDRLEPHRLQPIAAMLACTTAPFAIDSMVTIGESLLFHPHGVIAFLGGVQENYPRPNILLFQKWEAIASEGGTLGESFRKAKRESEGYEYNSRTYALLGDPGLTLRVPAADLLPGTGSGQSRLVLQHAGTPGDSLYYQVVQEDLAALAPLLHPENILYLEVATYLQEKVLKAGKAVLGPAGGLSLDLPPVPEPSRSAVKVMTWNGSGMRYGHIPFASLGSLAVRGKPGKGKQTGAYRLVLSGNQIQVLWTGPEGVRKVDLKGSLR